MKKRQQITVAANHNENKQSEQKISPIIKEEPKRIPVIIHDDQALHIREQKSDDTSDDIRINLR